MNIEPNCCPVYTDGESLCSITDAAFIDQTAEEILEVIPHLFGVAMLVSGYTLAGEGWEQPYLVVTLYTTIDNSATFGISFGSGTRDLGRKRTGFDASAWRLDPSHPLTAGIHLASWDEAWMLVCKIGRGAKVVDIQLRYGT